MKWKTWLFMVSSIGTLCRIHTDELVDPRGGMGDRRAFSSAQYERREYGKIFLIESVESPANNIFQTMEIAINLVNNCHFQQSPHLRLIWEIFLLMPKSLILKIFSRNAMLSAFALFKIR